MDVLLELFRRRDEIFVLIQKTSKRMQVVIDRCQPDPRQGPAEGGQGAERLLQSLLQDHLQRKLQPTDMGRTESAAWIGSVGLIVMGMVVVEL